MTLHKIRLEMARGREFPEGSDQHGYEFVAPLDKNGNFNAGEWRSARKFCTVTRFWGADPAEHGNLIHLRGNRCSFSYDPTTEEDDEPIFRFDRHVFRAGEYVSITEHDGVQRTFRVVHVR